MLTMQSRVNPAASVLFRELDGEAVLLELESGTYFGLDEVGTRFWSVLQARATLGESLRALSAEFEVDEERLHTDLLDFVHVLVDHKLMDVDGR